jgi:alpha-1,2-mannosyltransferase
MACLPASATSSDGDAGEHPAQPQLRVRRSTVAALIMWAAVSTVLTLTTVPLMTPRAGLLAGGEDFWVYREAARNVTADLDIYTLPMLGEHFYTYTPFSTIAFLPFGLLPGGADKYIWMAVNLVVLAAIVGWCWRLLGYRITPAVVGSSALLAIGLVFVEPVRTTLFYGQINLVLLLLVLWDTSCRQGSRLKGVGIGLAAGVKLTPAYFALYYLTLRKWRAAAIAFTTLAATICLGWLVLPRDSRAYWTSAFLDPTRVTADQLHPSNQSLRGALGRLLSGHPTSVVAPLAGKLPPLWLWLPIAAVVLILSMLLAVRLYRAGERLLSVTVTGLTSSVLSPMTWTHHWLWTVPVLVYFVHRAQANRSWWLAAAALFATLGSWPYRFPVDEHPRIGLYMFPDKWVRWECLSNLYIVIYAVLMIGAAVIAYHSSRVSMCSADEPGAESPANGVRMAVNGSGGAEDR